jgi:hypothetical protein
MALCAEAAAVIFLKQSVMSFVQVYPAGALPALANASEAERVRAIIFEIMLVWSPESWLISRMVCGSRWAKRGK